MGGGPAANDDDMPPSGDHRGKQERGTEKEKEKEENPLRHEAFVSFVRAGLEEWKVPGISVAVVDGGFWVGRDGGVAGGLRGDESEELRKGKGKGKGYDIWAEGFGYATLPRRCAEGDANDGDGEGVLAAADTLYYAGSTTKAFTSAVLGMMVHPLSSEKTQGESQGRADAASNSYSRLQEPSSTDTAEEPAKENTGAAIAPQPQKGEKKKASRLQPPKSYTAKFPQGLRTPISTVIRDDFVLSDEWATAHVTFEDALSHRTGLARHDKALADFYPKNDDNDNNDNSDGGNGGKDGSENGSKRHRGDTRDFTRALRHLPLIAEPRVEFRYCNLMFLAAARAVEVVTGGTWLGDVMREWIWEPLGMKGTYLSLEDAKAGGEGKLAEGYWWDYLDGAVEGGSERTPTDQEEEDEEEKEEGEKAKRARYHYIPHMDLAGGSGAGGIISSVSDYALWIRCLLAQAPPLSQACHRETRTPRMVSGQLGKQDGYDGPLTYALGWQTSTYRSHRVCQHSGGMEAYGTCLYFFPDLDFGVVTMGNTAVTANALGDCVAWRLIDDRLGVPEEERFGWSAK